MKKCSKCKIEQPYTNFNKSKRLKDGYSYHCKDCCKYFRKLLNKTNENHVIKNKNRALKWRKDNPEKNKKSVKLAMIKRMGLSIENYTLLLISQNHCCAICKTPEYELKKRLYIDHCHKTKKVRGLLCQSCNSTIGFAKDNIKILKNSIDYLKEHENGKN